VFYLPHPNPNPLPEGEGIFLRFPCDLHLKFPIGHYSIVLPARPSPARSRRKCGEKQVFPATTTVSWQGKLGLWAINILQHGPCAERLSLLFAIFMV
jgi:hypothetical protein